MNTPTNASQDTPNAATKNQSAEVNSLTAEDNALKTTIDNLRRGEEHWNRANRWLTFFAVAIGGLLGAAGFLAAQNAALKSSDAQSLMQRRDQIAARLRTIADQEYKTGIAAAWATASNAKSDAATANRQAQEALLEQSKLTRSNLELQATIERERTARVELMKTMADRSLNREELGAIRRATYAYKAVPLDIFYVGAGDPEVRVFAADINAAFNIWKPKLFAISNAGQPGLSVEFNPDDKQASEAAQHFFDALDHHGFRVNGPFPSLPYTPQNLLTPGTPKANLRLVVGERDPVYLPPELRK